jgi:hypothetical protein
MPVGLRRLAQPRRPDRLDRPDQLDVALDPDYLRRTGRLDGRSGEARSAADLGGPGEVVVGPFPVHQGEGLLEQVARLDHRSTSDSRLRPDDRLARVRLARARGKERLECEGPRLEGSRPESGEAFRCSPERRQRRRIVRPEPAEEERCQTSRPWIDVPDRGHRRGRG